MVLIISYIRGLRERCLVRAFMGDILRKERSRWRTDQRRSAMMDAMMIISLWKLKMRSRERRKEKGKKKEKDRNSSRRS